MQSEGSLPHSQQLATCPYPQPDQSSPCCPFHFFKIHFNIILPSTSRSSKWSLSLMASEQKSPMHLPCIPHFCTMLSKTSDTLYFTVWQLPLLVTRGFFEAQIWFNISAYDSNGLHSYSSLVRRGRCDLHFEDKLLGNVSINDEGRKSTSALTTRSVGTVQ